MRISRWHIPRPIVDFQHRLCQCYQHFQGCCKGKIRFSKSMKIISILEKCYFTIKVITRTERALLAVKKWQFGWSFVLNLQESEHFSISTYLKEYAVTTGFDSKSAISISALETSCSMSSSLHFSADRRVTLVVVTWKQEKN